MGAGKDERNLHLDFYWGCGQCSARERVAKLIVTQHCRIFSEYPSNIEHGPLPQILTDDLIRDFDLSVAATLPHRFELSGRDVHGWLEKLSPEAALEVQARWRLLSINVKRTEREALIRDETSHPVDQGELF